MVNRFINFFRIPYFQDLRELRRAQNLHFIMLGTLVTELVITGALFPGLLSRSWQSLVLAAAAFVVFIGTIFLIGANKRNSGQAANAFIGMLWASLVVMAWFSGGSQSAVFAFMASVIIMAGLVLDTRLVLFFAIASAGTALVFNLPSVEAALPADPTFPARAFVFAYSLNFIVLGLLAVRHTANSLRALEQAEEATARSAGSREALEDSQRKEQALASALARQESVTGALAQIYALAAKNLPEDRFLQGISAELADKLEVEHVAIFALDETGSFAYLQAASSQAGQLLIQDEGYRLPVRKASMIAGPREPGLPEVSFTLGSAAYRIARPVPMPEMNTEFNYPIAIGDQLIGLLNIQSSAEQAPGPDWERLVGILAAQLGIVIQNSHHLHEVQALRHELETISGQRISDAWQRISEGSALAYRFDRVRVLPQGENLPAEIRKQLQAGKLGTYRTQRGTIALAAPIQISGQVIGVIGYELDKERELVHPEETAMLDAIAAQLSIALENARLFTETQQRAYNEQLIASVSNRIRESLDLETVLRSATLEIQQALNVEFAEIRLGSSKIAKPDGTHPD